MDLRNFSRNELAQIKAELVLKYNKFLDLKLNLDMTRGKPCKEQLELSQDMMKISDSIADDGTDCRNYGGVDGISEAKKLFADLMEVNVLMKL